MGQPSNLVVLTGTVTGEPIRRSLRSGVDVVNFDVATHLDGETASVPIAWYDPRDSALSSFVSGEEIVVIGTVRRRFFRVGGQTQSRTEVVVATLVPTRRTKSARSALATAAAEITRAGE
jgi:single-strand DNA-binding protein